MATATKTTDHAEIRKWAEARGGEPARVDSEGHKEAGESSGSTSRNQAETTTIGLRRSPGEKRFKTFDENELAFLHQDRTADGQQSRSNKLVSRTGEDR